MAVRAKEVAGLLLLSWMVLPNRVRSLSANATWEFLEFEEA